MVINQRNQLQKYGVAALAAFGLLLAACASETADPTIPDEPIVELEEVIEDPSQVIYQELSLSGSVDQILTPTAFLLTEVGEADGQLDEDAPSLLVIDAAATELVAAGDPVRVFGELRPLDLAELEAEYDVTWEDALKQELAENYGDKPVLVAELVAIVE